MAGQMIMGFILPFALAFVAIPMESLLHSGRTVTGHLLGLLLRVLATALRILAILSRQLGRVINSCYDLLVIPLLWAERLITTRDRSKIQAGPEIAPDEQTSVPNVASPATREDRGSMQPSPI